MDLYIKVSLGVLSVLIVAANLFVTSLVCLNRVPRTYTNWLTVSLSVSDVLTGGILFPMLIMRPTHAVADYLSSMTKRCYQAKTEGDTKNHEESPQQSSPKIEGRSVELSEVHRHFEPKKR